MARRERTADPYSLQEDSEGDLRLSAAGRFSRRLTFPVALFVLVIASLISVTDQLIHGQITVYVMTCVAMAVVLYLTWAQALLLYGSAHLLFLAGLRIVQDNIDERIEEGLQWYDRYGRNRVVSSRD